MLVLYLRHPPPACPSLCMLRPCSPPLVPIVRTGARRRCTASHAACRRHFFLFYWLPPLVGGGSEDSCCRGVDVGCVRSVMGISIVNTTIPTYFGSSASTARTRCIDREATLVIKARAPLSPPLLLPPPFLSVQQNFTTDTGIVSWFNIGKFIIPCFISFFRRGGDWSLPAHEGFSGSQGPG